MCCFWRIVYAAASLLLLPPQRDEPSAHPRFIFKAATVPFINVTPRTFCADQLAGFPIYPCNSSIGANGILLQISDWPAHARCQKKRWPAIARSLLPRFRPISLSPHSYVCTRVPGISCSSLPPLFLSSTVPPPLSFTLSLSLALFLPLLFDRAVGIPSYNDVREGYGLSRVTTFEGITSDEAVQGLLEDSYGDVDLPDAYTGALAENHNGSALLVGPLLKVRTRKPEGGGETWYDEYVLLTAACRTHCCCCCCVLLLLATAANCCSLYHTST